MLLKSSSKASYLNSKESKLVKTLHIFNLLELKMVTKFKVIIKEFFLLLNGVSSCGQDLGEAPLVGGGVTPTGTDCNPCRIFLSTTTSSQFNISSMGLTYGFTF